jgi:hypothetical protein
MAQPPTAPATAPPAATDRPPASPADVQRLLSRDLRMLAVFIDIYCRHKHRDRERQRAKLGTHDVEAIAGRELHLCEDCRKLLAHAFVKRSHCPMNPKPMCKHCPQHCYHPTYRAKIQEVMRFSGKRSVVSGRFDFLLHLLF